MGGVKGPGDHRDAVKWSAVRGVRGNVPIRDRRSQGDRRYVIDARSIRKHTIARRNGLPWPLTMLRVKGGP
jgi:hypothetical protein